MGIRCQHPERLEGKMQEGRRERHVDRAWLRPDLLCHQPFHQEQLQSGAARRAFQKV
ncbi:hypothetical protein D3C81_517860 [compost metagenome]